jgi:hypothetical protein
MNRTLSFDRRTDLSGTRSHPAVPYPLRRGLESTFIRHLLNEQQELRIRTPVDAEWNARRTDSDTRAVGLMSRSEHRLGRMISRPTTQQQDIRWIGYRQMALQQHGDPVPSPSDGWNRRFVSAYQATPTFGTDGRPAKTPS